MPPFSQKCGHKTACQSEGKQLFECKQGFAKEGRQALHKSKEACDSDWVYFSLVQPSTCH